MVIAIVDLRENNGHVAAITDEHENIAIFGSYTHVERVRDGHALEGYHWLVIDLEDPECSEWL